MVDLNTTEGTLRWFSLVTHQSHSQTSLEQELLSTYPPTRGIWVVDTPDGETSAVTGGGTVKQGTATAGVLGAHSVGIPHET